MPKVLVLGGSFAGIVCCHVPHHVTRLSDHFPYVQMAARNIKCQVPHADITIVDQKDYFEYTPGILRALVDPSHLPLLHARMSDVVNSPSLLQQAVGWWPTAAAVKTLWAHKSTQAVPAPQGLHFLWGTVQSLDTEARRAVVQPCSGNAVPFHLAYDYVVLATGSDYAAPMKPSPFERCQSARVAAVAAVHAQLHALSQRSALSGHVLVIGGGAVGVEMVGELVSAFPSLRVSLVSSSSRLLAEQTPAVGAAALAWCATRGVQVLLGVRADRQSPSTPSQRGVLRSRSKSRKPPLADTSLAGAAAGAPAGAGGSVEDAARAYVLQATQGGRFKLSSGDTLDADMVFTCVGFKPSSSHVAPPNSPLHATLAPSKQITVNDQLQAQLPGGSASCGRVFSAGDVALHAASSELKLAHTAEMMAHTVAANVAGSMHSNAQPSPLVALTAVVWSWLLLLLRVLGIGSSPVSGSQLHAYPGHMTGYTGWPIPRVMCISLGPSEAILVMNGMSLTSYPGRVAGAWAKWVIETSKMWATRDLAIGHAIWAFGDAAAVTVSNFVVLPLAQNQPPSMAHRVGTGSAAPGTATPLRFLWGVWLLMLSCVASALRTVFPSTFVSAHVDAALDIPAQTTASF